MELLYLALHKFLGAFRKIAKSDYQLRHVCLSVRPPAWNNSVPTGLKKNYI